MRLIKGLEDDLKEEKDDLLTGVECPSTVDPLEETSYTKLLILIINFQRKICKRTLISEQNYNGMTFYSHEVIDLMKYFKFPELEIEAMRKFLYMMLISNFNLEDYLELPTNLVDIRVFEKLIKELRTFSGLIVNKFCQEINSDLVKICPDIKILFLQGSFKDEGATQLVEKILQLSQAGIYNAHLMIRYFSDIYRNLNHQEKPASNNGNSIAHPAFS